MSWCQGFSESFVNVGVREEQFEHELSQWVVAYHIDCNTDLVQLPGQSNMTDAERESSDEALYPR